MPRDTLPLCESWILGRMGLWIEEGNLDMCRFDGMQIGLMGDGSSAVRTCAPLLLLYASLFPWSGWFRLATELCRPGSVRNSLRMEVKRREGYGWDRIVG